MARASRQIGVQTAPRTIIGYHGCSQETAHRILDEQRFLPSAKAYDWLGAGIYFWEYAPYRALDWARQRTARRGEQPAVIRATIKLGRCLNLLDVEHMPELLRVHRSLVLTVGEENLPRNTQRGAHYLDRLIIDSYCRGVEEETAIPFQTVRGVLPKGSQSILVPKSC